MRSIALQEQWRIGGDDEDVLLGIVTRVLVDDANNIYLLDQQLSEVQVFTPGGEHLKTLGRHRCRRGRAGSRLLTPNGS
ncbi:MAG: hypothetical protein ABR506_04115 [Candidatus Krumholzibacteriia bacterium]